MKFKNLFPIFIATIALLSSCTDEKTVTLLDEIQVSSSYVSLPVDGGSNSITITAKDSWTVEKVVTPKDSVKWLSLSSATGNAGESELTFTAPSALDGRTAEVLIHSGGKTQRVNVIQGITKISAAKVSEVNAGPDGKTYRVTGICTSIANTDYGNWYLTDATGTLYVYGTLDKKGATRNFKSLNLEVGDEVTVEGPKLTYGTTVELVNVTVININKSLIKVDSIAPKVIPVEGGEAIAYVTCKGQGVSVEIPTDAKSWLSMTSIQSAGTHAVVKFNAAANTGGDRKTTITFNTTDGTKNYSSQATLTQNGAIVKVSVAEFIAAPVSSMSYRLSGVITKVVDETAGNFNLTDFSGETYVYKLAEFKAKGLKLGDIVTIVGKRADFKGTPQVGTPVFESVIPVTSATIAEMLAKADDPNTYFMVTGTITDIATGDYGNLTITDGTDSLYSYGCYPGYGATGAFRTGLIAAKGIKVGDTITIIGPKGSRNGVPQISNGIYFSHVSVP